MAHRAKLPRVLSYFTLELAHAPIGFAHQRLEEGRTLLNAKRDGYRHCVDSQRKAEASLSGRVLSKTRNIPHGEILFNFLDILIVCIELHAGV